MENPILESDESTQMNGGSIVIMLRAKIAKDFIKAIPACQSDGIQKIRTN